MYMKRTVVLGLLALASWAAHAGEGAPGFRAGVAAAFGQFSGNDVPAPLLDNKFIDDNAVGFKMYGQYQLNDWLGVEAAYHFSNTFEDESKNPGLPGKLKLSFSGFSVQGLLYVPIPMDDFQLYVKAGYYDFDDELAVSGSTISNSSERGLVAGAGGMVRIMDHVGVRLDYDWFDADVGDLGSVNLGVEYYFGAPKQAAQ